MPKTYTEKELNRLLHDAEHRGLENALKLKGEEFSELLLKAKIEELESLPMFYEYVESGEDRLKSQATEYIEQRIKKLRKELK